MMKLFRAVAAGLVAAVLAAIAAAPAEAGSSCSYIVTGAQLTAAQWNFCFTAKQNELGYTPVNKAGDGMQGLLTTVAPTTSIAGFRLYPGVAPTVPVDGDLWTTTAGIYVRINGATVGPLRDSTSGSFAATAPLAVAFPASVVTYSITGQAGGVLAGSGPAFTRTPVLGVAGTAIGTLGLAGSTSGTVTVTPQATAGSPTLTLPNASGTFAVSASSPIVVSATTGNITCPTCATSSGGGAITGTPPVAVSAAGVVSITGAAGQVLAGASPAFTATPALGVAGSTLGTLAFANLTSGSITLSPVAGALGSSVLTLPAATDTVAVLAAAQALTNKTVNGLTITSTTGTLTITAGKTLAASNTMTLTAGADGQSFAFPAASDTIGGLATTQTWTAPNTHTVTRSIASATGAALDDIGVTATTTTITGNTGSPITRLAKVGYYRPTLTDASAVTVTDAATLYVDNSPLAAGSVTITNAWAILVGSGASKLQAATIGGALTYGGVTLSASVVGTGAMVLATSPALVTPALGVATATSLAINGATIGTNALAVTGSTAIASSSASALAVGLNGATNPALQVDASTASSATGLKVKSAAAAGGLALSVVTSGTNENLTIDAAGSGTITFGTTSTGAIVHTRATTLSAALTYGGVTLANSVQGTGSMVLATSPALTTPNIGAATATSINGNTFTAGTYTLTGAAGKTLTFSNTMTFAGTDGSTYTMPGASATIPRVVASGTLALATSSITANTCTSAQTAVATGTLTTDSFEVTFNADPIAVTGYAPVSTGGLTIWPYPTADTFNVKVCNPTSTAITPGAISLNFRNVR